MTAFNSPFIGYINGTLYGLKAALMLSHRLQCKMRNFSRQLKKLGVCASKLDHVARTQIYLQLLGLTRTFFLVKCKNHYVLHSERIEYERYQAWSLTVRTECINVANNVPTPMSNNPLRLITKRLARAAISRYPQISIVVFTYVKQLIAHNCAAYLLIWTAAPAGIFTSGRCQRNPLRTAFALTQSAYKSVKELGVDQLNTIDVVYFFPNYCAGICKHLFYACYLLPNARYVGFTAVRFRLKSGSLNETTDQQIRKSRLFVLSIVRLAHRLSEALSTAGLYQSIGGITLQSQRALINLPSEIQAPTAANALITDYDASHVGCVIILRAHFQPV